eukprot:jgi/Ulvmu1/11035/UM007_0216.1
MELGCAHAHRLEPQTSGESEAVTSMVWSQENSTWTGLAWSRSWCRPACVCWMQLRDASCACRFAHWVLGWTLLLGGDCEHTPDCTATRFDFLVFRSQQSTGSAVLATQHCMHGVRVHPHWRAIQHNRCRTARMACGHGGGPGRTLDCAPSPRTQAASLGLPRLAVLACQTQSCASVGLVDLGVAVACQEETWYKELPACSMEAKHSVMNMSCMGNVCFEIAIDCPMRPP